MAVPPRASGMLRAHCLAERDLCLTLVSACTARGLALRVYMWWVIHIGNGLYCGWTPGKFLKEQSC